jgi:hypothetical protein
MVVQITETPSVNVAAQDAIYSEFFSFDLELSARWLACNRIPKA